VTGAESIEEDLDDAPNFNTSLGFDELGREIFYCSSEVIVVGIPCGPLEDQSEQQSKPTPIINNTEELGFQNCPPRQACVDNDVTIPTKNNQSKDEIVAIPEEKETTILIPEDKIKICPQDAGLAQFICQTGKSRIYLRW
jgi:hypothetical protein